MVEKMRPSPSEFLSDEELTKTAPPVAAIASITTRVQKEETQLVHSTHDIAAEHPGTGILGEDIGPGEEDDEIIVYVAPHPRNGKLASTPTNLLQTEKLLLSPALSLLLRRSIGKPLLNQRTARRKTERNTTFGSFGAIHAETTARGPAAGQARRGGSGVDRGSSTLLSTRSRTAKRMMGHARGPGHWG
ncbi:hypothetical protein EDB89DRAFT_1910330 [Lactarius sanguifluus]|nr:hypothetical protein EDB89DRAFT_1910330 [Lactarius sanguifluus]